MNAVVDEMSKTEQAFFENGGQDSAADKTAKDAQDAADATKKAADDAKAAEEAKKAKVVPLEALHEARAENKELKSELKSLKEMVAQGDTKLSKFIESVQKRVIDENKPQFENDPAGALKAENDELKKAVADITARQEKQEAAGTQNAELSAFGQAVAVAEKAFVKEHPAYYKAAEYLNAFWADEFREAGAPETNISGLVYQKALSVTYNASKAERNPAETVWKIAARAGFKAEAKDDKPDGESKLAAIEKGQKAAKTVDGNGGDAVSVTLASLAQMADDDIDKLVADPAWWSKNIRQSRL